MFGMHPEGANCEGFDAKDGDLVLRDRDEEQHRVVRGHGPESGCVAIAAEVSGLLIRRHAEGEKPEGFDPKDSDLVAGDRSSVEQNPVLDGHGPESDCLRIAAEVSGFPIDEDMLEVKSVYVSGSKLVDNEEGAAILDSSHGGKGAVVNGAAAAGGEEDDSTDDGEDSSSQISSSSSGSEEEDEDEDSDDANVIGDSSCRQNGGVLVGKVDMEEGELDELVGSDDNGDNVRGPIRSKHELEVLPPVPRIEVQLQAHHQTSPVGAISSILGDRVIIESSTKHNPLTEGSILWITESRAPLGVVDEVFGPVKNPYYVVRYNFEKDLPSGISVGTAVSFVVEFADHILNEKELHKKGYDASGDNDEELMDEFEFSDDEKEAEYRRSLREAKRGTKEMPSGRKKPFVSKRTNSEGFSTRMEKTPLNVRASPVLAHHARPEFSGILQVPPPASTVDFGCNNSIPIGAGNSCMSGAAMVPGAGSSCMSGAAMAPPNPIAPQIAQALQLAAALGAAAQFSAHTGACAGDLSQQLYLQQLNSLGQQQHNVSTQQVFATNILQNQLMGANNYQQHHQNQNIGRSASGMPYEQQFAAAAQIQARPVCLGGQPNPSLGAISLGHMGQANFTRAPFVSGNMQNIGQRPPTTQGGASLHMQFNPGNPSFRRGNAFRGGSHRSLPRRG